MDSQGLKCLKLWPSIEWIYPLLFRSRETGISLGIWTKTFTQSFSRSISTLLYSIIIKPEESRPSEHHKGFHIDSWHWWHHADCVGWTTGGLFAAALLRHVKFRGWERAERFRTWHFSQVVLVPACQCVWGVCQDPPSKGSQIAASCVSYKEGRTMSDGLLRSWRH